MADDDGPMRADEPDDRAPGAGSPRPAPRSAPGGPGARTEKALSLELARLFGLSPRLMAAPSAPATEPEAEQNPPPDPSDP
jgi:hypothetical protein